MSSIDGGLRPEFKKRLRRGFHWQSVETGGTGLGIPDSNFCASVRDSSGTVSHAVEGWLEYKQTDGWAVGLSVEQVGWHKLRWARGGWTLIATRRWHDGGPRKGPPVDELWLHEGRWAGELASQGLRHPDVLALGVWSGGPAGWNWREVEEALRKGRRAKGRGSTLWERWPVLGDDAGRT